MAYDEFFDGFDSYGPVGFQPVLNGVMQPDGSLLHSEWTALKAYGLAASGADVTCTVIEGLLAPGTALRVNYHQAVVGVSGGLSKTLEGGYQRIHFGGVFRVALTALRQAIVFGDTGVDQCAITIEPSGQIGVRRGPGPGDTFTSAIGGTLLAVTDESVADGEVFHLAGDITFDPAGSVEIWLNGEPTTIDGVALNTAPSGVSRANEVRFICQSTNAFTGGTHIDVDHFYVRGFALSGSSDLVLTNPIVETSFPVADDSIDFAFGAAILGPDYAATTTLNAPGANQLFLRRFTPVADGTLEAVTCWPQATALAAKFKAVAYADSAGVAGALLSAGPEVVGCTAGELLTGDLTTPQALTAGTAVWLGFITDTAVALALSDDDLSGSKAANTYAGGAPGPAPAMTAHQASWVIFGTVTGVADNFWSVVDQDPLSPDRSFMTSATLNAQDLYVFDALSTAPLEIYSVAVKAVGRRTTSGARAMDLRMKSGASEGSGLNTGIGLPTTYATIASYFRVDPDTAAAWNTSGVNAATAGYKITT